MTAPSSRYGWAWLALMALAAISYGATHMSLATMAMPVALGIASLKIGVVLTQFMHVRRDRWVGAWALGTALVFVAVMGGMIVLDLSHR